MRDFLDDFESHPSYYRRIETTVILEDGSQMNPWIYFLLDFKPELLDLVTYEDYNSYGDHGLPYVEREKGIAEFVGKGQTVDKWPLVISSKYNIPYLLNKKDFGKRICGEIYSVDDKMRDFLDDFESHPSYYRRIETTVILEDGSQMNPWMYFLLDFKPELLDLVTYEDYNSYGDHGLPYVESEQTSSIDDMNG
ncbi:unnamed protein product [Medioppia subpectinata]|uniref:Gamma-glutamylcyclotransferase family protein n=1 Tax=Medioppia subpectinata TaxID=1979941 RepID=A0A7R9KUF8_9ACAR|nr:unnamed protein product [Medioppia subpectinata]CAG2109677.1 unnamed protein product [Medioppia subpectinata]